MFLFSSPAFCQDEDTDYNKEILSKYVNSSFNYYYASSTTYNGNWKSLEGKTISEINFHNNRMLPEILAKEAALKKGAKWKRSDVLLTEDRLNNLKMFKETAILSVANGDTITVDIYAKDDYYILPIPFFTSGGSGESYGLILLEGNLLKRGETLFAMGMLGSRRKMATLGGVYRRNMFLAAYSDEEYYEHEYADGGFNTAGYYNEASTSEASELGTVVNTDLYRNKMFKLGTMLSLSDQFSIGIFYSHEELSFSEITANPDLNPGNYSEAEFSLGYRSSTKSETRQNSVGFAGALFGMGLSKLKYELNDLEKPIIASIATAKINAASKAIGSEYDYIIFTLNYRLGIETKKHNQFIAYTGFSASGNLPYPKKLSTTFDGVFGDYAKAFLGETRLSAGVSYKQFLLRNQLGILSLAPFAEQIYAWSNTSRTKSGQQTGAGIALGYTFWRFPLPLSLVYTHSFENKNDTLSFKAGLSF